MGPHIINPIVYVGCYQIGGPIGLRFNFTKRPNAFHRWMTRLLLGWIWIDTP